MTRPFGWMLPLFVPATRPDRFAKAAASGADAIIIDLEDAVAPEAKDAARDNVSAATGHGADVLLRVNAHGTPWHAEDLACARRSGVSAILLAKAERAETVAAVYAETGLPVIGLIETLEAVDRIDDIAAASGTVQMAFGTMDLAAELGCAPSSPLFDGIRLRLLLASTRAAIASPLDGVSLQLSDDAALEEEARRIAAVGFAGRLLVHPAQVKPTSRGLAPTRHELDLAGRIAGSTGAAARVDGQMVDRPVRLGAERLLRRAERLSQFGWGEKAVTPVGEDI